MYTAFNQIDYPLVAFNSGSAAQIKALRSAFIDFKLYVTGNVFPAAPKVTLVSIYKQIGQPLKLQLTLTSSTTTLGSAVLNIPDDQYATQEFVRYYFDSDDFIPIAGYKIEGYICITRAQDLFSPFSASQPIFINRDFEPGTIVALSHHRVDQLTCRYAKPLLQQTPTSRYTNESEPVLGDVKLIPGNNCTISVLPSTKTIIIGAQRGANDSGDELCGTWSDKVNQKDTLCNEAIYGISGVNPDSNGNINITAQSPLVVSNLTALDLANSAPQFNQVLNQFSHIIRFIYVGLPQSENNPSVFNCDT
jgi:hypothetical protein